MSPKVSPLSIVISIIIIACFGEDLQKVPWPDLNIIPDINTADIEYAFNQWMVDFDRSYPSKTEYNQRLQIFTENIKTIIIF